MWKLQSLVSPYPNTISDLSNGSEASKHQMSPAWRWHSPVEGSIYVSLSLDKGTRSLREEVWNLEQKQNGECPDTLWCQGINLTLHTLLWKEVYRKKIYIRMMNMCVRWLAWGHFAKRSNQKPRCFGIHQLGSSKTLILKIISLLSG